MKKKLVAFLLVLAFAFGVTAFASSGSSEEPLQEGPQRYVGYVSICEIRPERTMRISHVGPLDGVLEEFFALYNDPNWDGYIPWEMMMAVHDRIVFICDNPPPEIDRSEYEYRIVTYQDMYGNVMGIYVFDFLGNELDIHDPSTPADIVKLATCNERLAALYNARDMAATDIYDMYVLSTCPCAPPFRAMLRHEENFGACSSFCFRDVRHYSLICTRCGAHRGNRTDETFRRHEFTRNPQGIFICQFSTCRWVLR